METFLELDTDIVVWLNQGVGRFDALDYATYLVVSDYFVPLAMCFWMLGLWFSGRYPEARVRNQRAVLIGAISMGFANLVVLLMNQPLFRERPFAHHDLTNLLYQPSDPSFPANAAAVAFALAMGVCLRNRRAAVPLFMLAALWTFARVYNGVYYPSDVLAGALIGIVMAFLVSRVMGVIEPVPTWVLKGARLLNLA